MRSDDRDLCDTLTRWAEDLEATGGDAARSADDLYAAVARIEQMSATISEWHQRTRARRCTDQSEIDARAERRNQP